MDLLTIARTAIVCYLIGAIPTAYLIGRLNGINIFEVGSGNMGATNAIRALGWGWGVVVWAIDISKGIAAVALAMTLLPNGYAQVVGGLAAILGHNWSLFAALLTGRLRGGKGAATWMGTFLMIAPTPSVALVIGLFAAIVLLTRYVSLGVLLSVAAGAISLAVLAYSQIAGMPTLLGAREAYIAYGILAAVMIFYRHRDNIQRLLAGTERRLGERA
ncbi:MAG: glycerol-3-phosphate 1-O-acyltransferase PlsY [Anaerolineae bacterium]|nr:glycerol-3-phosphate 1-O-acyltransferase PlsY [Anaerolineae bacterium]